MTACMSSARPITPNSATDLCAEITSSIPGRRDETTCSPVAGWQAPPGLNTASYDEVDNTTPDNPRRAAPAPPHTSRVTPPDA